MSDAIKPGDLVMVVKPAVCCGSEKYISTVFTVSKLSLGVFGQCDICKATFVDDGVHGYFKGGVFALSRLKKIDPPETGDSLPTRTDLNLPVPACP